MSALILITAPCRDLSVRVLPLRRVLRFEGHGVGLVLQDLMTAKTRLAFGTCSIFLIWVNKGPYI